MAAVVTATAPAVGVAASAAACTVMGEVRLTSAARTRCGRPAASFSSVSSSSSSGSHGGVRARAASGSRVLAVRAVAAEKAVEKTVDSATTAAPQKAEYHFLVANAKFMLNDEEHFQELMKERLRHFGEVKKEQDFWLVIEPDFLASFPDIEKRLGRPAVALVSTDSTWITFMKLRLDRVLKGAYEANSLTEALAGGNSSVDLKFEKPGRWTAPYTKYEGPWWTPFLLPQ